MRACLILIGFLALRVGAQPALQHYGDMQLHEGAQMGLHLRLQNEAPFDQNLGLLGFYGNADLRVDGGFAPGFFDVEIAAPFGVVLGTSVLVANNLNFIIGDFRTDRALTDQYVGLLQNAFTVGEADASKVDGYVLFSQQQEMIFPVGDIDQYRPLTYQAQESVPAAKCAYFREDPTNSTLFGFLDPDLKPRNVESIGRREFWRLEGSLPGTVTLTWNQDSDLELLSEDLGQIELVGWNKSAGRWLPLGTVSRAGDLQNGFAISDVFLPDDFEVLTFASLGEPEDLVTLPNYYLSPNGDGINDFLVIEELEQSPNNQLRIYDRRGLLVYSEDNYSNRFEGVANVDGLIINREAGLPEGVYFYLVGMLDLGLEYQGFLYLRR